jgi:1,4-alpha-glucan branching enzyme
MYRHLDLGARRMEELARRFPQPSDLERRALNQAARQLLLAQASDWAFILKTGTFPGYARRRFAGHMANFLQLYHALCRGNLDAGSIASMEELAPLLATVDYRQYLPEAGQAKRSGA